MSQIETVRGPIEPEKLGATLPHEHIFAIGLDMQAEYPDPEWDEDAMHRMAVDGLNELAALGIRSLVDLTVPGIGRSIPLIQKVAAEVDLNILVATGYYTPRDLPAFYHRHSPTGLFGVPDPLPLRFIRDIDEGIAGTGVKAAVIKVVTDIHGMTPDIERILRAGAIAHLETGVPISTHTHAEDEVGRQQQDLLEEMGVPLERVIIGHSGDTTNINYLIGLLDRGSTLGLDRFGMEFVLPDELRMDTLVALLDRGYVDQLTLSHDAAFYSMNIPLSWKRTHTPHWRHSHIPSRIVPMLLERGVAQETIDTMMVTNPAKLFQRF